MPTGQPKDCKLKGNCDCETQYCYLKECYKPIDDTQKPQVSPSNSSDLLGGFLCLIGWHEWEYKLSEHPVVTMDGTMPDCAKCTRCGKRYKPAT